MTTTNQADRADGRPGDAGQDFFRCDFCSRIVPSVRRVALDGEYERLRTAHATRYACPSCSQAKERERLQHGGS